MEAEFDYLKGSPIDRTFFIFLEVAGIAVLWMRHIDWGEFIKKNRLLLFLYLYMVISVLWSDFPTISFKRWVRTVGDLIMVTIIITEFDYITAFNRVMRIWGYLLIPLSVFFVKYWRKLGVAYDNSGSFEMWIGVTTHKNSLGQLVCIFSFFIFWAFVCKRYKQWFLDLPILFMALWLLTGSKTATSRTSLVVFLLGTTILILLKLLKTNLTAIRIIVGTLVGGFLIGNIVARHLYSTDLIPWLITFTGGDPTLTGRTLLWDELLKIGANQYFFGSGYGGFWLGGIGNNLWETFSWHPGQAHNGYIDVYIDLGIIGLILLIALIVSTYRDVLANLVFDSNFGRFRMALLGMILFYNITESSFLKPTSLLWFMFLFIAIQVPQPLLQERHTTVGTQKIRSRRHKEEIIIS
jgi:O-antigen ligase